MKKQKVEIELPEVHGWEFLRFGYLDESEIRNNDIGILSFGCDNTEPSVNCLTYRHPSMVFIYRRKKPKRIIFEESGERKLTSGDYYYAAFGNINKWKLSHESTHKHIALKKIHDDFEVYND